jgi:hypothetical protein
MASVSYREFLVFKLSNQLFLTGFFLRRMVTSIPQQRAIMQHTPNTLEIVHKAIELQNAVMNLLAEVERQAWNEQHNLQMYQERVWALEQVANPNDDGHPYSDTYGN